VIFKIRGEGAEGGAEPGEVASAPAMGRGRDGAPAPKPVAEDAQPVVIRVTMMAVKPGRENVLGFDRIRERALSPEAESPVRALGEGDALSGRRESAAGRQPSLKELEMGLARVGGEIVSRQPIQSQPAIWQVRSKMTRRQLIEFLEDLEAQGAVRQSAATAAARRSAPEPYSYQVLRGASLLIRSPGDRESGGDRFSTAGMRIEAPDRNITSTGESSELGKIEVQWLIEERPATPPPRPARRPSR
jgi:hypothetical protein